MQLWTIASTTWSNLEGMTVGDGGYILREIARVGSAVDRYVGGSERPPVEASSDPIDNQAETDASRSPFDRLADLFGLSPFERDVLIACVAVEIDPTFAQRCATAHHDQTRTRPTFALALAAFGQGHLAALAASSPLRRHRLIELHDDAAPMLHAPISVDERILQYVLGISAIDPRLEPYLHEVAVDEPSTGAHAEEIERIRRARERTNDSLVVTLFGASVGERRAAAGASCRKLRLELFRVRAADLPSDVSARFVFRRAWEREALLHEAALLIELDPDAPQDVIRATTALLEEVRGLVIVSGREPLALQRTTQVVIELPTEGRADRLARWHYTLGPLAGRLNGELDRIAAQFTLAPADVTKACEVVGDANGKEPREIANQLWDACRAQARPRLDELARRIPPQATWDDLVLSDTTAATLRDLALHLRHRHQVFERWGLAARASRGLGTAALFFGGSGTGKTLAAEVLAREARLDLYHIDLSQVVNKYIGETEKNLRRVFDAAEEGGAILLFDEADALFGKRAEVEKGTDRYANIEVSYLLQRIEAYRGLAILTTNQRDAVDKAFLRRLRFVVEFPFPHAELRMELWRRAFPTSAPTAALDLVKLARLQLTGGHIRNIAINAAMLAAEQRVAIGMSHVVHAARAEYKKVNEQTFPEIDFV
ncbi:MAG: ATP-binding protein [Kofleriaceae bacterium]